jgi:hypothetical protein
MSSQKALALDGEIIIKQMTIARRGVFLAILDSFVEGEK